MDITPTDMVAMMLRAIQDLDEAQNLLEVALHNEARKDKEYRDDKHMGWQRAEGRSVDERVAHVDFLCGESRLRRDLAVAESKSLLERVRNKRQSLSALQSAANSIKEEAAHSRVGPDLMQEVYGK